MGSKKFYEVELSLDKEIVESNRTRYKEICYFLFEESNEVARNQTMQQLQDIIQDCFQDTSVKLICVKRSNSKGTWISSSLTKEPEFLPRIKICFLSDKDYSTEELSLVSSPPSA